MGSRRGRRHVYYVSLVLDYLHPSFPSFPYQWHLPVAIRHGDTANGGINGGNDGSRPPTVRHRLRSSHDADVTGAGGGVIAVPHPPLPAAFGLRDFVLPRVDVRCHLVLQDNTSCLPFAEAHVHRRHRHRVGRRRRERYVARCRPHQGRKQGADVLHHLHAVSDVPRLHLEVDRSLRKGSE